MTLVEFLRATRMTQAEFAELIKVHPITVNAWVNGRAMPRRRHVQAIEQATDGQVTRADLIQTFMGEAPKLAEPAPVAPEAA